MITIQRYGESDEGSGNSLISYAGQPYLNFCYFFNAFENPDGVTLKYLFPSFHHFVLGDFEGSLALQKEMYMRTGIYCGVFYTLLGDFMVSDGRMGPFILTIVYLFVSLFAYRKHKRDCSFENYFVAFLLMLVPTIGIITYYYNNISMTISLILVLLLLKVTNRSYKYKKAV